MYFKKNLLKTLYFFILFIIILQSICFASNDLYVWSSDYSSTIQTGSPVNSNIQSETDSNIDDTKTNNFLNLESPSRIISQYITENFLQFIKKKNFWIGWKNV